MTMSRWRHSTMGGLRISVADAILDLDGEGNVINAQDVTPAAAAKMRAVGGWVEVALRAIPPIPSAAPTATPTITAPVEPEPAPVAEPEPMAAVMPAPAPQPLAAPAPRPGKGKRT